MSEKSTVIDPSAFTKKSPGKQVLFSVITLGLYSLYWIYTTAKQLDGGTSRDLTPILAIIPFVNLVLFWQISSAAEAVTEQSKEILFILFLFFAPLSWYWIQTGINDAASTETAEPSASQS